MFMLASLLKILDRKDVSSQYTLMIIACNIFFLFSHKCKTLTVLRCFLHTELYEFAGEIIETTIMYLLP